MKTRTLLFGALCILQFTHGHGDPARQFIQKMPKRGLVFPFKHAERTQWHYVPGDRLGFSYQKMNPTQKAHTDQYLQYWLSPQGWKKLQQIRQLESVLGSGFFSSYHPDRYFVSFFGTPPKPPWAFRFEGHHLSLNFTTHKDSFSFTPFFWGANPAKHTKEGKTIEPLRQEQQLAKELVRALSPAQKKLAIISQDPLSEVILTPGERLQALKPKGIAFHKLEKNQQTLLLKLIDTYLNNFSETVRSEYAIGIKKVPDQLYFAWAGSTLEGKGHYYRIQNSQFVVEYDNTQNGANHIHTVWHDLQSNFGRDALKEHYQKNH